jgi:hypothetical protein
MFEVGIRKQKTKTKPQNKPWPCTIVNLANWKIEEGGQHKKAKCDLVLSHCWKWELGHFLEDPADLNKGL